MGIEIMKSEHYDLHPSRVGPGGLMVVSNGVIRRRTLPRIPRFSEHTEMLNACCLAISRMADEADWMGAHAVANMRFASSQTGTRAAELFAYGTAVKIRRY